jgi:hypothetical protein
MQAADNILHNDMAVTVTCRYTLISDNPWAFGQGPVWHMGKNLNLELIY